MRRVKKISFKELVIENKKELLQDRDALDKIEMRLDEKHSKNA
jgi:hypothetical protein